MRKLFFVLLLSAATVLGATALTVNNTAGRLAELVGDTHINQLTVIGEMDASDFLFITNQLDQLTELDLSQAAIVACDRDKALYGTVTSYAADEIPRTAFFGKKLTSVALPLGLKSIGLAAFAGCYQLRSLTLPASVTYIDDYAFAGSALTSVVIPATVQGMGKGVFARCEDLQQAQVNALMVGDFTFLGDHNLSSVTLGSEVQYILRGVFNGCTSLHSLNIDPACRLSRIDEEAFINSGLENIDVTTLGVATIGDWALAQTRLSSMTLPDGMTELGVGALAHNPLLTTVTLPGMGHAHEPSGRYSAPRHGRTLNQVKDYTFAGDELLHAGALLRDGVTTVGDYAFYNVSQDIDTMRLPASITRLGDRAMAGMTGMKVLKTDAATVPELGDDVWAGVDQPHVQLLPPDAQSTEQYRVADQWMNFFIQPTEPDFTPGDVNGDGKLDVSDVSMLIGYILGSVSADNIDLRAANVNGEDGIDVSDVSYLIALILGKSASLSLNYSDNDAQRNTTTDALAVSTVALRPGQTRTIQVALNNDEYDYTALQLAVVLPHGVTLTAVQGVDRGSSHNFSMRRHDTQQNIYLLMGVSMQNATFAGHQGNIMSLTLQADDDFDAQNAELLLAGVLLVNTDYEALAAGNAVARVTDASGIEQVTADKQVASVRYINVAGVESEAPFDGVNIVVTTYTDGTSTAVKVVK